MHRAISVSVLALILIGWCCLSRAADTDPLKGLTQKIEAGNLTGRDLAEAYMQRGAMRMILKDESGAAADYDQAVSTAPKLADAYLWRSFGRSETGDFQHAVDDISQALSLGLADEAAGYYFRAEALRQMKDYRRAIDDYDHAIALDRDFGYAFIGRGEAKTDAGDEAGALTDLTQAVEDGGAFYVSKKWPFRTTPYLALLFGNYLVESTPDKAPPQAYLARGRLLLQRVPISNMSSRRTSRIPTPGSTWGWRTWRRMTATRAGTISTKRPS